MKLLKTFVYSLFVFMTMLSCKKSNIQPKDTECKFTLLGKIDSFDYGNVYFYYNDQNMLIGRSFNDFNSPFENIQFTPRFDTIVYNLDKSITIFHYRANTVDFKVDETPAHAKLYFKKTNITYGENGISKMVTINELDKVISQKFFIYQNGILKTIKEVGIKPFAEFSFNSQTKGIEGQTEYSVIYDGNNVKSIISVIKYYDNTFIGGDTIKFPSFSNLKNPYKSIGVIWDYYFKSLSENMYSNYKYNYYYYDKNWFQISGSTETLYTINLTNNGNNYPMELGKLKCN